MRDLLIGIVLGALALVVWSAGQSNVAAAKDPATAPPGGVHLRVGTYDPRAVAIAWARSPQHKAVLDAKMKEMKDAKAAGDQKKIDELKNWGQSGQRRLHFQGFAGMPVNDLLADVKDKLPDVARAANVDAIAQRADYVGANAEAVDITDELVKIFSPDERTLKIIADMKTKPPLDLLEVIEADRSGKL